MNPKGAVPSHRRARRGAVQQVHANQLRCCSAELYDGADPKDPDDPDYLHRSLGKNTQCNQCSPDRRLPSRTAVSNNIASLSSETRLCMITALKTPEYPATENLLSYEKRAQHAEAVFPPSPYKGCQATLMTLCITVLKDITFKLSHKNP